MSDIGFTIFNEMVLDCSRKKKEQQLVVDFYGDGLLISINGEQVKLTIDQSCSLATNIKVHINELKRKENISSREMNK